MRQDIHPVRRPQVRHDVAVEAVPLKSAQGVGGRGVGQLEDFEPPQMPFGEKAADAGDSDSMNGIGYLYQNGLGVAQDYGKAMEWYQKSADAGNSSAMANIAYMYEYGEGVPANQRTAMEWYQKAADAGDEDAKAKLAQ